MGRFLDEQEQKTRLQKSFHPASPVTYEFGLIMFMIVAHTATSRINPKYSRHIYFFTPYHLYPKYICGGHLLSRQGKLPDPPISPMGMGA